jgi:oligoribonuclease NrnB/cAMP/cGMP phosphodiesterase (DHH superfamily)
MNAKQPVLLIYHAHCTDGFTAAWVCELAHHNTHGRASELFPASYGDEPPDVTGRDVEIVDFSYSREQLIVMHEQANSLVVLDHHEKAQTNCEGLDFCTFDMERSGAMLAHNHHYPRPEYAGVEDPPLLVQYVQDRDLWRFELAHSKEINAYIGTIPKDMGHWLSLASALEDDGFSACLAAGQAVLSYKQQMVERIAAASQYRTIAGFYVPVVNSPILQSELGHHLCQGEPFAAVWYEKDDGSTRWSLRSAPGGENVNEIAQQCAPGGGGHKHAAGFALPPDKDAEFLEYLVLRCNRWNPDKDDKELRLHFESGGW